jgi:hypothetical protein
MLTTRFAVRIGTFFSGFVFTALAASAQVGAFMAVPADEGPCSSPPASPRFSIKPGAYTSPQSVSLTAHTRGAIIFYTTDGWTPTSSSTRYMGPISIDKTTTVEAIALVPNCSISKVATATYSLPSAAQPLPEAQLLPVQPGAHGTLALSGDAQIPLVFALSVDSRTAKVGDSIALTLAEDLKIGNTLFASRGTPATGKVIQVDRSGVADLPGEIQFQVDSLNVNGMKIPLHAVDALAAPYGAKASTLAIGAATTGGLSLLFVHGKDARIPAGAALTATIAAGTQLSTADNLAAVDVAPGRR